MLSYHSRASGTSGTVSSAAYPWSFSRTLSAGSRSATCGLLEVGLRYVHGTLLRVIVWAICASHGEGSGDVVGVLTLLVGGVVQAFHDDRVVELRVQLGVEEVEERRQGGTQVEVEREKRVKEGVP